MSVKDAADFACRTRQAIRDAVDSTINRYGEFYRDHFAEELPDSLERQGLKIVRAKDAA